MLICLPSYGWCITWSIGFVTRCAHVWEICRVLVFSSGTLGDNSGNTQQKVARWMCRRFEKARAVLSAEVSHECTISSFFPVVLTWCMVMSLTCGHAFLNIMAKRIRTHVSGMGYFKDDGCDICQQKKPSHQGNSVECTQPHCDYLLLTLYITDQSDFIHLFTALLSFLSL